ncbi:hypothetical protein EJB05_55866, partial [Eragrostis curvula]
MQKPLLELFMEHGLSAWLSFPREAINYECLKVHISRPLRGRSCGSTPRRRPPDGGELMEHGLSPWLFPREATNYEHLTLRAAVRRHGDGRLTEVEGFKTKVFVWVRVTTVEADAAKLHFTAWTIKRSRTREA